MARTKTVTVPPALDLPLLPSDLEAETRAEIATVNEALPPIETTATNGSTTTETSTPVVDPVNEQPKPEMDLLERLRRDAEMNKRDIDAEWINIVQKVADKSASEDEVTDILSVSGRTLDELQAAVDRERELARLRALITDYDAAEQQCTVARQAWVAFKKRRDAISTDLEIESKQLRQAEWEATRRRDRCRDARIRLQKLTGVITNYAPDGTVAEVDRSVSAVA